MGLKPKKILNLHNPAQCFKALHFKTHTYLHNVPIKIKFRDLVFEQLLSHTKHSVFIKNSVVSQTASSFQEAWVQILLNYMDSNRLYYSLIKLLSKDEGGEREHRSQSEIKEIPNFLPYLKGCSLKPQLLITAGLGNLNARNVFSVLCHRQFQLFFSLQYIMGYILHLFGRNMGIYLERSGCSWKETQQNGRQKNRRFWLHTCLNFIESQWSLLVLCCLVYQTRVWMQDLTHARPSCMLSYIVSPVLPASESCLLKVLSD